MPMLDVTAPEGTFSTASEAALLERLTRTLLTWEKATDLPLVVANTGAYLHVQPGPRVTAGGKADRVVRVEILTPPGSLTQAQRQGITADVTRVVSELAEGVGPERVWVLFREAADGGWGIAGRALTNADIAQAITRAGG
jgi:phenylpyruvate tautomerase PptA (4-oxalocrotonate tautomerase family)